MLRIFVFLFIILLHPAFVDAQDIIPVRNMFYRAVKSSKTSDSLFQKLSTVNDSTPAVWQGYKAMSHFMISYHSYNPYTKFSHFLEGKKILEKAITKDPNNIELRFLRLTSQLNTPSFLGYQGNIAEDKASILNKAKNMNDLDLFHRMYEYSVSAKKLSAEEKKKLQKALLSNKLAQPIKL